MWCSAVHRWLLCVEGGFASCSLAVLPVFIGACLVAHSTSRCCSDEYWDGMLFIITVYLLFRELLYCDTRTYLVLGGCNFLVQGRRACLRLCSFCYPRPPLFYLFCHFTSNLTSSNPSSLCCISWNMLFIEHWRGLQDSRPIREIRGNNIFTYISFTS